jgi:hypothetical protein
LHQLAEFVEVLLAAAESSALNTMAKDERYGSALSPVKKATNPSLSPAERNCIAHQG